MCRIKIHLFEKQYKPAASEDKKWHETYAEQIESFPESKDIWKVFGNRPFGRDNAIACLADYILVLDDWDREDLYKEIRQCFGTEFYIRVLECFIREAGIFS